ncbi:MAG: nuclear transport factor 2 family protein [Verrucomicrobia bacterium]|nr:nuclear transport factor 2 family protein [Verrucomicrobiota bacterium]MCH8527741.1 nuclear transport factor 2 family protein [Kiritimatiellia bacterium]
MQKKVVALEKEIAAALIVEDLETLTRLLAEDFLVNNPANMVLTSRDQVMDRIHSGIIRYEGFEQRFEEVRVYEGLVMVMGEETVRPGGIAPGAGQILRRRFTNIWMFREGAWVLSARHANIIDSSPVETD